MIKYMSVPFEIKSKKISGKYFEFSGYLSTFGNVDRDKDVVLPGAFTKTLEKIKARAQDAGKTALLPLLWQHISSEPIGAFFVMNENNKGLYVEARMPMADTLVTGRVIPQMEVESIDRMSIGYTTEDSEYENSIRLLKEVTLWEGSLVTIAANVDATVDSMAQMKAAAQFKDLPLAPRNHDWDPELAEKRIQELIDKKEIASEKAFFYTNQEDSKCTLQFADVIDGKLCAIPRAIFAVAATLQGACGGVDLQDSERASVIRHVEKYYSKLDLESPFQDKASFRIDDIESMSIRTLENLLQTGVHCTRKGSKALAGLIKAGFDRDDQDGESTRDASTVDDLVEDFDKILKILNR